MRLRLVVLPKPERPPDAREPGNTDEAPLPDPALPPPPPPAAGAAPRAGAGRPLAGQLERLFYALGMTPAQYALRVAAPLLGLGVMAALALPLLLVPVAGEPVGSIVGVLGGLLLVAMAVLAPFQASEAQRHRINQQMHVFITHLGVLSTTPMVRVQLFGAIASKEEYGPLAKECARIRALVEHWHLSLPEACRFIAARTPSDLLGDFLDRLAHALEAGDQLEEFMVNEQAVVMHEYAGMYRRRLNDLGVYRELFSSMMMSVAFLAVFALLMPVLANMRALSLMPMVLLATGGLLLVLLGQARMKTPRDPLWQDLAERSDAERRANLALPIGAVVGLLVLAVALAMATPLPLALAGAAVPIALAALPIRREEARVRRRDDNYAAFVRSLGAGAASRGGAPQDAVEQLSRHDYGPLTPPLRRLHARLATKLSSAMAWRLFAVENGSHLIHTFNNMFLEGAREGGDALKIGGIISRNMVELVSLRKERAQLATGLRGTLYGMAGAIAFTLYLNLSIVNLLTGIFSDVALAQSVLPGIGSFQEDLGLIEQFVLAMVLAYAACAALVIRIVDGGRLRAAATEFAVMAWIGAAVASVVGGLAGTVL